MPRAGKVLCPSCDARMLAGLAFCPHCGAPTIWASGEDRARWEVEQWQRLKSLRSELMASELGMTPGRKRPWYVRLFRLRKTKAERLLREWQYSMAEYEAGGPGPEVAPRPTASPLPPEAMGLVHELEGKILALEHRIAVLENLVVEKARRVPLFNQGGEG